VKRQYLIIAADFWTDMGKRFVCFALLDLLVFHSKNPLTNLVLMSLIQHGPSIFLSPFAGIGIDRIGAHRWLTFMLVFKSLVVATLVFVASGWGVFPVYLGFITLSLFFTIGLQSLIPAIIPKDQIFFFNALNERVAISGGIIAPWLIGLAIAKTGQKAALATAALLFALAVGILFLLPKQRRTVNPRAGHQTREQARRNLFSGYGSILKTNPGLEPCFFVLGFVLVGGGILNFGLPLLFKQRLGGDISQWGVIISGFQAGSFLATFLLPRLLKTVFRKKMRSFAFLVLGAAMYALTLSTSHIQMALLMVIFGCGFTLLHIFWESLIQQTSPKQHMGKVMSLLSSYKGLCYLGIILSGALVIKLWNVQSLLFIGALLMGSASLLANR